MMLKLLYRKNTEALRDHFEVKLATFEIFQDCIRGFSELGLIWLVTLKRNAIRKHLLVDDFVVEMMNQMN